MVLIVTNLEGCHCKKDYNVRSSFITVEELRVFAPMYQCNFLFQLYFLLCGNTVHFVMTSKEQRSIFCL